MKDLGKCTRHPDEPALFRCPQCHDAVCVGCRAPDERDLCRTCGEYRQASVAREARVLAGEEPDEKPRVIPWGRWVIVLLVAVDIGLGVYLTLAGRPDAATTERMDAVAAVARVVDESRDAAGRYPPSLAPLLPRVPGPAAEMIRTGVIRYEVDADRTDYTLRVALGRP